MVLWTLVGSLDHYKLGILAFRQQLMGKANVIVSLLKNVQGCMATSTHTCTTYVAGTYLQNMWRHSLNITPSPGSISSVHTGHSKASVLSMMSLKSVAWSARKFCSLCFSRCLLSSSMFYTHARGEHSHILRYVHAGMHHLHSQITLFTRM